jgi:hypothetical protein
MKRVLVIALLATIGFTACSGNSSQRSKCVDEGKIVIVADPTDQLSDTFVIGCISVEQYHKLFNEWYRQHTEISDD